MVGKKEKKALAEIISHMDLVAECAAQLEIAYQTYLGKTEEEFITEAKRIREIETQADDARRKVQASAGLEESPP